MHSDNPARIHQGIQMEASRPIRLLAAVLVFAAVAWGRPDGQCAACGHALPSAYWLYEAQACCSQACVDQLKPLCSVCEKTVSGGYISVENKSYCSTACFDSTLPACDFCRHPIKDGFTVTHHNYCKTCYEKHPACFSCGLPAAHASQLEDGREVCAACMRWAVKKQTSAQPHFDRALRQFQAWTALKLDTVPALVLVNRADMRELSQDIRKSDSPVSIRGLYSRQITTTRQLRFGITQNMETDVQERIYIVDHLHDAVFRTAVMHELMHDLLQEYFPRLEPAPSWVHEGICQQAAAEYCRRRNYVDILYGIEHCTDPDYGDGYRYIKNVMGMGGWPALRRWMETVDVASLPETAP
jgi:hypothetical protein